MDKEQLLKMDSFMLLSIINMKLRDEFDSLNSLCEDYEISSLELENKLSAIGYKYNKNANQFKLMN
ncbi:DUF4250 domain-containing protein [Clostridium sp. YIM B02515]|uniref:DUF4250 domain-containing protein n=1 Tax=Clostridium rhizosphaerae TaxID=2803861 RepID=A0ABS1TF14_9CLOT|nr:DUF4250 domain-containing protein [Clostridium rhizosphaerae]MBL4936934.1 DUF4250 domain-containing protein [Clostridium rhizosphaerae]